ncbi:MAG: hypothetical protein ACFB51_21740 [Anaerolineae bacterium]
MTDFARRGCMFLSIGALLVLLLIAGVIVGGVVIALVVLVLSQQMSDQNGR